MDLSTHFQLEEFECSQVAARMGIDNTVPAALIPSLRALCTEVLERIRDHLGPIQISSGYRCLALNRAIGSKDTSQHVKGEAADILIAGMTPLQVCQWIAASGVPFDQVIHEYGQWTHVSHATVPRYVLLTIDRFGTREGLLPVRTQP